MSTFSPELLTMLDQSLKITQSGKTAVLLFEDMFDINEHFQAVIEWYREQGNPMKRRFQQGCFMQSGVLYFAGADTTPPRLRGVERVFDVRQYSHELVRKTGLEARMRAKTQPKPCTQFPDQPCLLECEAGCVRQRGLEGS